MKIFIFTQGNSDSSCISTILFYAQSTASLSDLTSSDLAYMSSASGNLVVKLDQATKFTFYLKAGTVGNK
jgi:hypothetical protein